MNVYVCVYVHAGAPAVLAFASDAVILADDGAPAVLAFAAAAFVLTGRCSCPAVLARGPLAVVLADAGAPAVLALASDAVMHRGYASPVLLVDAEGENGGWKIKVIILVGGTSESVHVKTFNDKYKRTSSH
jgi:hypothetical protein